jgi:maltooligosyltrehalose trehalohydrolase
LHHAIHALLTGERHSYYEDFGTAEHIAKALNDAFVRDGSYSHFHRRRHGTPAGEIDRSRFVVCIQNHDQVGNRASGDRLGTLLPPKAQRLAAALMLLSPCTPMLFMGEEYGETRPFPFFCSFGDAGLVEAVRRGRRAEVAANGHTSHLEIPDPQAESTFESAKLDWHWPDGSPQAGMRRLYAALLAARRNWPALADRKHTRARCVPVRWTAGSDSASATDSDVCPTGVLILERGNGDERIIAVANCTDRSCAMPDLDIGGHKLLLSTAAAEFGGPRAEGDTTSPLLPYELLVYGT